MLDSKIETFLQVVRRNSYTAAAQALHLTQPAVTQHIRKLEAYYNCKLIDSSHKSVQVTEAGNMLFSYLSLQQANEKRFSSLLHHMESPLCIGATLSIADYYLSELLVDQMLTGRERIRVMVGNTAHLLDLLHTGALDGAFIEGSFNPALFETHTFYQARFLPVVCAGHPLLDRQVGLDELHAFALALREPHSGTREVFETWLWQQGDSLQSFPQVVELGSFVLIKQLVRRSQAITFVYEAVVKEELARGELCVLDLEGFEVSHALRFAYRKGDVQHQALERFFQELLQ